MTQKQSTQLVKSPNTKKALQTLKRFAELEAEYKALEKESKKATELIKDTMIEQGIDKVNIDMPGLTGYITLAERVSYKAEDLDMVEDKYLKSALDTSKVKAEVVLTGKLPEGVTETRTQYITKKLKTEE